MNGVKSKIYFFDSHNPGEAYELGFCLRDFMNACQKKQQPLIFLCIGTDRSTGDSLGPLIGYKLSKMLFDHRNFFVYGTLSHPVHALNLEKVLDEIKHAHEKPFIIAIDAALGSSESVGFVTLSQAPLYPGLGVKKSLPGVGDLSITGIVNVSGSLNHALLETTRLSVVMEIADAIVRGIRTSLFCL